LINKPGFYTLKDTAIEVSEIPANGNEREGAFLAFLPLVLRPGFKEDAVKCAGKDRGNCVAVVDTLGTAACICRGRLAWSRDSAAVERVSTNNKLYVVKITGSEGTDVR
jgi:hypothetical protein